MSTSVPLTTHEARRVLDKLRCCGSPSFCGARCMDDAESHEMAQLVAWVDQQAAALERVNAECDKWESGWGDGTMSVVAVRAAARVTPDPARSRALPVGPEGQR